MKMLRVLRKRNKSLFYSGSNFNLQISFRQRILGEIKQFQSISTSMIQNILYFQNTICMGLHR